MSDARQQILDAVRRQLPQAVELPDLAGDWITYDDPRRQFVDTLEGVGGNGLVVPDVAAAKSELEAVPAFAGASQVCSLVGALCQGNVDLQTIDDPHDLRDVDYAVLRGDFAVAENAAIWIPLGRSKHRVLPFVTQHLAIVLRAEAVLDNMHQAYERLEAEAKAQRQERPFAGPGFGVFVSGPSKTADIEQSLVIGAHGARSLTVLLVESGLD